MFSTWSKSRRLLTALGIGVISWAAIQTEGIASGEFVLTDRIGEGSVLHAGESADEVFKTALGQNALYLQDGKAVQLTQIQANHPYCKFVSTESNLGETLKENHKLVVRFKNVARARWFFDHDLELECLGKQAKESISESDFHRALGKHFLLEMHRSGISVTAAAFNETAAVKETGTL